MQPSSQPGDPVTPEVVSHRSLQPLWRELLLAVGLLVTAVWAYWPVLAEMARKWSSDPQYSHAYLVPAFCAFLAWRGIKQLDRATIQSCAWGLLPLIAGIALRLAGTRLYLDWLEAISLIPTLAGAVLLIGGWHAIRNLWLAIAFLVFMVPLPYSVETGLSQPLQRFATNGATVVLQTIGRPAFAEGNVIVINDAKIGVTEACNGLGMFLLFFAMAAAVAAMIRRPLWEKLVVFVSAAPIAIAVNIFRIVVTTIVHEVFENPRIDSIVHDFAGWLMMPLALVLLWLELKFLSKLFVDELKSDGHPANQPSSSQQTRAKRKAPFVSASL